MDAMHFDFWTRGLDERTSRRALGGLAAVVLAGLGLAVPAEAKKKKKKKKKKTPGTTCDLPYFACGGECRLEGACCDSIPSTNCANMHAGEGGNWVCCTHAGFGCYNLDNDKFNCGGCGVKCGPTQHCLNGDCLN